MRVKNWIERMKTGKGLKLVALAAGSLAVALSLAACENVASSTSYALVRVIDASSIAETDQQGGVNFWVEGVEIGYDVGYGTASNYTTLNASSAAKAYVTAVDVTKPTSSNALVSSEVTLLAGTQHSMYLTDNGVSTTSYTLTVLQDHTVSAPSGESCLRILNESPTTGTVDVYLVPSSSTLADSSIWATVELGSTYGYKCFTSQTVTLTIEPTGVTTTTTAYTKSLALTGGEVETILILNNTLVSTPAMTAKVLSDVD